jgi:hypothetical protein
MQYYVLPFSFRITTDNAANAFEKSTGNLIGGHSLEASERAAPGRDKQRWHGQSCVAVARPVSPVEFGCWILHL